MDLNFYSELSGGSPSNVDSEYLNGQAYGGYSEENKVTRNIRFSSSGINSADRLFRIINQPLQFPEGSDSYLSISGQGHHPFLSAAVSRSTHQQRF